MKLRLLVFAFSLFQFLSYAQCPESPITLSSQAEVDTFNDDYPDCASFSGFLLTISGADINDLTPLSTLTYVSAISIINNPLLTNLEGLDNLQSDTNNKTYLRIENNPSLVDLNHLQGLTSCSSIIIVDNDLLTNLDALNTITSMGIESISVFPTDVLRISDNDNLTNISGLSNLNPFIIHGLEVSDNLSLLSLEGLENFDIMNTLSVQNNSSLLNLNGLNNVIRVFVDVSIAGNDNLNDLTGLESLSELPMLNIEGNTALTSLNGISNVTDIDTINIIDNLNLSDISNLENFPEDFSGTFVLSGNTSLAVCDYPTICNWLSLSDDVQIENNDEGCNSFVEVGENCPICPTNTQSLVFNSQEEIDNYFENYPGCTELENVIRIEGNDITNVNGLNGITSFGGLWVVNNPLLEDLNGLNSLTDFDFGFNSLIYIENNPLLTNLNGLANAVNDNPMDLTIKDNPQLISLDGLQGIQGFGYSIGIINNDLIVNFNGLNGFTGMDDFYIEDNDSLTSFVGLDNLSLTGSFVFINNDSMTSFASLSNIVPLCGFTIKENDVLTNIDGFTDSYVEGCSPQVTIENNPMLALCNTNFICDVVPYLENFHVSDNAEGCNTIFEVTNACEIPPFNDDCVDFGTPELVLGETLEANNNLATASSLAPSCNDVTGRQDLWFSFNSGDLNEVTIVVSNNYSMQLWEGQSSFGSSCSDIVQVENACGQSILNAISVTPNTNYFVQVWSNDTLRMAFSSGDFQITVQDASLSLNNFGSLGNFNLYPNPFKNQINLSSDSFMEIIYIYDIRGKIIQSLEVDSKSVSLNMADYDSGVYFLKIEADNRLYTKKMIKN